jgi:hypothetical protein
MLVLMLIYRIAAAALNHVAFHSARSRCGHHSVVGCQSSIWTLCPQDALRPRLWRPRRRVRPDDLDGVFRHDRLSRRSLEREKFAFKL